jgi:NADPH2:quinone reductase
MKAMIITQFGGPEVFEQREVPSPHPQAQQLLVKVHATAVNPIDLTIRQGKAPWTGVRPPAILGYDVSGVVEAVGEEVHDFQLGDEVYYTPEPFSQGSNAEYHVVNEAIVAHKPSALSHLEAASIPLVGSTAWEALITRAQLQPGETVLIHGGAGGVGSLALQIAKARGATVLTTCRGSNRAFARSLGADYAIDYREEDVTAVVNQQTQGAGVDVVFDAVGSETLAQSIVVMKPFGRLVSIVGPTGDVNGGYSKQVTIHFSSCQRARSKLEELRSLVEQGRLKPVIDSVMSLAEVAEAHKKLEEGGLRGKIVLSV